MTMRDAEAAMGAYAQLAWLSHQKRQPLARDRFLLLAGAAACDAGWPTVAAECYRLLAGFAPRHQLSRFPSFPDALRDADFRKLVQAQSRRCPFERAEHMLVELEQPPLTTGDSVRDLLMQTGWNTEHV